MEEYQIYLEIFGYVGTALVIISMLMTSVMYLRIFNLCGSIISMIYALITGGYPIAFLNFALIIINVIQLLRLRSLNKNLSLIKLDDESEIINHYYRAFEKGIKKDFPTFCGDFTQKEVFALFSSDKLACFISGDIKDENFYVDMEYISSAFLKRETKNFLYSALKEYGINKIHLFTASEKLKKRYLNFGFKQQENSLVKIL